MGNGSYPIAETGCLLTAFCNLAQRFGHDVDPPTLNSFFTNNNIYIDAAPQDGLLDDLDWAFITRFDSNIIVETVGNGTVPPSNDAIVRFHYIGIHTGQPVDHFCLVDHVENGRVFIIDSWDGHLKAPEAYESIYGKVLAWATYGRNTALPPTPPPPAIPTPEPIPASLPTGAVNANSPPYQPIIKDIPGYMNATNAANHIASVTTVLAGTDYFLFTTKYGMDNVTKTSGVPGTWINPSDNVSDPDPLATPSASQEQKLKEIRVNWQDPVVTSATSTTAQAITYDDIKDSSSSIYDWRKTYKPFVDEHGKVTALDYVFIEDYTIHELYQDRKRPVEKQKGQSLKMAGIFTASDGEEYLRPLPAATLNNYFGVPGNVVTPYDQYPLHDTEDGFILTGRQEITVTGSLLDKLFDAYDYIKEKITRKK